MQPSTTSAARPSPAWSVLAAISLCHLINDMMQSMLSALYPLLEAEFSLKYWQIGMLTLAFQGTASVLQPVVGLITDRNPMPRSLPAGMAATFIGIWLLAFAPGFALVVLGAGVIGIGSAVFHPESSRVTRLASSGRYGTAQSIFQVGGNSGAAIGPLLAALIVAPFGRPAVAWFSAFAALGIVLLYRVGNWAEGKRRSATSTVSKTLPLSRNRTIKTISILLVLVFSKYVYQASLSSFLTLFVIQRFDIDQQTAMLILAVFMAGTAIGVMMGGMVADRIGTRTVIWFSILGVLPFTLALPHAGLYTTGVLVFLIGLILSSAFPAIVVYAQELMPGRTGLVAGLFFGLAFGIAGIAAVVLGLWADMTDINLVYQACAWLPVLGIVAFFLPEPQEFATP